MQLYSVLFKLAQIDKKLAILAAQNEDFVARKAVLQKQVAREQSVVSQLEQQLQAATTKLKSDETKLEDEQHHIADRRKQMASLGGNKQAKLLEREIDVARRSLDDLESHALNSMEQKEKISRSLEHERNELNSLSQSAAAESDAATSTIERNLDQSAKLKAERDVLAPQLDAGVLRTYDRIRGKYPAEPVARVADGHCQSCFRALPPQMVNLVDLGQQVQQCPGCHRLLVLFDEGARE